ncbi:MAG: polymerase subunit gamma and tau [Bacteroidetes bacterium]|nr:polymerase subunit gamma and tau [Bacteroidota bacterium]
MSEYLVTARKWRPMVFEDVVGQEHVTTTLRNAISSGRLAHAYLFSGPRGVGKTTTARLLAKAVNCINPRNLNPDNDCDICREITEGRSFDVLEIDGASNRGVEEIRNLREGVRYAPAKGKYRVYIIDEVHMLTKEAFNALLKTLEEPPAHVLFIFATTEMHKLPATILSRCQRFEFRRIPVERIRAKLKSIAEAEGIRMDDEALLLIARRGDGSLRDAQSIFDQVIALCGADVTYASILEALHIVDQDVYFRVTDLITAQDAAGALALVDELFTRGHDIREFLGGVTEHLRNLLLAKTTGNASLIEASDLYRKRYMDEAKKYSIPDLLRYQRFVGNTESGIRWSSQPRFRLEADMVQLVTLPHAAEIGEVLSGLDELKKKDFTESTPPFRSVGHSQAAAAPRAGAGSASEPPFGPLSRVMVSPQTLLPHVSTSAAPSDGTSIAPQVPPRPPEGAPASTRPAPGAVKSPPAISEREVQSRWLEFLTAIRQRKISLGTVMDGTWLAGVTANGLRIGCRTEFEQSSIERNREMLAGLFGDLFHVRLRIEAVYDPDHAPARPAEPAPAAPPEDHPIIAALKRELGAEPL